MIKIKAYYMQEADKHSKINKILNLIKIEGDTILIPLGYREKKIKKLVEKIKKNCNKRNVTNLVISKKLQESKNFIKAIEATRAKHI